MELTPEELERYKRNLALPDFGEKEQIRLKGAKVAITGAGGLGSPVSTYLALAGVGNIAMIDMDKVDLTNLNRQFLYNTEDIGKQKAELAAKRLNDKNPEIDVSTISDKITYDNAFDMLKGYDAVVDCMDNFPGRYAVNDACAANKVPLFHGAVLIYEGRAISIIPDETACFRCVFPEAPPSTLVPKDTGILGPVAGLIGTIQAIETLRYLAGLEIALKNTLLIVNADTMDFNKINVKKRDDCTACGRVFVPKPIAEVSEDKAK